MVDAPGVDLALPAFVAGVVFASTCDAFVFACDAGLCADAAVGAATVEALAGLPSTPGYAAAIPAQHEQVRKVAQRKRRVMVIRLGDHTDFVSIISPSV